MTVKIDKGFVLPTTNARGAKWPWDDMEVGDSFLYEGAGKQDAAYALCAARSRGPKKFSARKMPDGTMRIWRTA